MPTDADGYRPVPKPRMLSYLEPDHLDGSARTFCGGVGL